MTLQKVKCTAFYKCDGRSIKRSNNTTTFRFDKNFVLITDFDVDRYDFRGYLFHRVIYIGFSNAKIRRGCAQCSKNVTRNSNAYWKYLNLSSSLQSFGYCFYTFFLSSSSFKYLQRLTTHVKLEIIALYRLFHLTYSTFILTFCNA